MLDKHIGGVEIRESKGAYWVGDLGNNSQPVPMTDAEARNKKDAITGRMTRQIEQELADDPYAQEYFSKLLKEAIEKASAMFDAPIKQYMLFADLEEQLKERNVAGIPLEKIRQLDSSVRGNVQIYYGLMLGLFADADPNALPFNEDKGIEYALKIDQVVHKAVAEYSINPHEMENQIRLGLLPVLYQELGMQKTESLITDVTQNNRLRRSSH